MTVSIRGYEVQIDREDAHFLKEYTWCPKKCGEYKKVYLCRTKGSLRLHRMIMAAQKGQEVDHIDGNTLNNRKDNLRFCTHAQNLHNMSKSKTNTSGLKGVFKNHKRWMSRIKWENKDFYLGTFDTREEAHEAYKKAAVKYAGEFARW